MTKRCKMSYYAREEKITQPGKKVELSVNPQIFKSAIARGRDRYVESNTPHRLVCMLLNPHNFRDATQMNYLCPVFMLSAIISGKIFFADLKLPM